jgi:pyruvate dehydrogenase E2 component (dihydrolipoyllysine-residue acetyltransferase)
MANEVKLPRLGQGMEAGTIIKWLKSEGDQVEKGEPLYELDTDKVTQEVEADFSGVLLKIAIPEGEVEVGKTIAFIGEEGEEVETPTEEKAPTNGAAAREVSEDGQEEGTPGDAREGERERGRQASASPEEQVTRVTEPRTDGGGRIKASPLARRIARERGIELARLTGTGPEGRVVAEDVERAAASPAPAPAPAAVIEGEVEVRKLSSVRRTIARRLTQAWEAPAFQISMSADMARALELRERLVERAKGAKPTVTDVLSKACAVALIHYRDVNVQFADDALHVFPTANVGIAVAIPDGLVVPVIPSCESKSIAELAAARAAVVARAREGKLQQADLEGGTFTISNLGMYGVEQFTAVLNPPQAAILAVGAIEEKPVVEDGELVIQPLMTLTLTCDHRAVDGATAAEFLGAVKDYLEEPGLML